MNLKPGELDGNGYILLDQMHHTELVPFVKKFISKRTWSSAIYYISMLVFFFLLMVICMKFYRTRSLTINMELIQIAWGVMIALALIPVHELIHALAYKLQGAKQTSFDANLKKFYFLAIADKFVASRREFQIVALSPFVIISFTLLLLSIFAGAAPKITIFTVLMIHSTFCSGDFALSSFFEVNKKKEVITYDDKENKISFFYEKAIPSTVK